MYISLNWLKDFLKIPAKLKPSDLAAELTKRTVEVEGVASQAAQFSGVVVGRVLEVMPHPNADRLRLTVVDTGQEKLNIVCGAPNVAVGQLVPIALVGTILPGGLEIKEAEIRGAKSEGMICAEDELGLGKEHAGIMVLEKRAKLGEAFAKYLRAEDVILEIDNKSLSNRPDLLSHYGLARELSVIFNIHLKAYDQLIGKIEFPEQTGKLAVKVEDKEACPRYQAVRIDGVKIQESPTWLKDRLVAVGQRPINNIVDLTNYVMLEIGQPLHAFDAAKVSRIVVRRARKNETIITLDGQERILTGEDLVIAVDDVPAALAGIMGGLDSGVGDGTTSLILEAANFQAATVRRTSQKLGLRSESSVRFEKSLDPNLTETAIRRFIALLKKVCPEMKVTSPLTDLGGAPVPSPAISLDLSWLDNKLGQPIPRQQVINFLDRLGFIITDKKADILEVATPSWRATKDIRSKEDLAEEVLRFYGYDNIVSQLPTETLRVPEVNRERALARRVKEFLAYKHALVEVYNYSFIGEELLTKLDIDFSHHLRLANPLSEIHSLLRRNLAPGLIANIRNNQAKAEVLGFFELGAIFSDTPGALKKEKGSEETLPYQEQRLSFSLADDNPDLFGRSKGVIASLVQSIFGRNRETEFLPSVDLPGWADKAVAAKVMIGNHEFGLVAKVSQTAAWNLNLKKPAVIAELNFSLLTELVVGQAPARWQETTKYPPVRRDIAIVVGEKILYNDLKKEIIGFSPLIRSLELFDVYSGDKLGGGLKSLAFHLEIQSAEKTLTTAEVDETENGLIAHLGNKFDARLREF